jgi:hypothetical protein
MNARESGERLGLRPQPHRLQFLSQPPLPRCRDAAATDWLAARSGAALDLLATYEAVDG